MIKVKQSKYYKINTPEGLVHIHIVGENGKIEEIFIRPVPIGSEIYNICAMLGVFISESIKRGLEIEKVIKHLNSTKSNKKIVIDENTVIESIPQAVAICLKDFLGK